MTSPKPLRVRLGVVIQHRRRVAGWSQEAFADRVGVHRTFMSTVERGLSNLSLDNLERIARSLGIAPGLLLLEADGLTDHGGDAAQPAASDSTSSQSPASRPPDTLPEGARPASGNAGGRPAIHDAAAIRSARGRDTGHGA